MSDDPDRTADEPDPTAQDEAVENFLDDAETVLSEYSQGYMDADDALSRLTSDIDDLRAEYENTGDADTEE
ncbi:hypothetical protein [Candidatus Halobonum tyrrellensis]|uniref:Uncharacterized protein n=1 Tax=Candidatus Halobonum tyrrellensis G22 TaxID=1324957 RepID=V4HMG2_9EURY|nr:hypothetical protein [Candidatus Halobonum tyrrellensis]ESP89119.1 hypothetical protein K933_05433 [Candidatus Halobonum tyrrellensis G22]